MAGSGMTTGVEASPRPRIVAGFDGSAPSAEALGWAACQADRTGAALQVLATWEWPASYGWALAMPEGYSPADDTQATLDEAVKGLPADHKGLVIETVLVEGRPGPALVDASTGADLLVVGCRGHGSFSGMMLGSVSLYCVAHAHCPVLVYRDGRQHG